MIDWFKDHPLISIVLVLGFLIGGSLTGWLPVDRVGRAIVRPLGSGFTGLGRALGDRVEEVGQIGNLSKQNQSLSEDNNRLIQEVARLRQLEIENQQLRDQLNFAPPPQWRSLGADVINYQPDSLRNLVRVGRGSNDGVAVGQPVLAAGNLLGVVQSVNPRDSEVMLLTDGEFRVLVKSSDSSAPGIIKGRPPASLIMERVPQDKPLRVGETVITSGLDGQFPAGIRIGEIVSLEAPQEAIFQTAQIRPAVELTRIRVVTILIPGP